MGDLSAHFSTAEFRCRCLKCQTGGGPAPVISPALIACLEDIRGFAGIPLHITSGFRCPEHNAAAGGKPNSAHLTGEAADLFVSSDSIRFALLEAAIMCGVLRIGLGRDFIHIDVSKTLPNETAWRY